jgi:hypothetical protein
MFIFMHLSELSRALTNVRMFRALLQSDMKEYCWDELLNTFYTTLESDGWCAQRRPIPSMLNHTKWTALFQQSLCCYRHGMRMKFLNGRQAVASGVGRRVLTRCNVSFSTRIALKHNILSYWALLVHRHSQITQVNLSITSQLQHS